MTKVYIESFKDEEKNKWGLFYHDDKGEKMPLKENWKYGGFEQVGSLGSSLPRNDEQTTTDFGDIVLYSGDQIVIFYGPNSWAYTRLGHILADKEIMEEALGNGDVTIELVSELMIK